MAFVILFSLVQLYIAVFLAPRFTEIFWDMLGNQPLPSSTAIVLHFRWVFVGLACFWPLVASFLVQRRASPHYLVLILALLVFSIGFTSIALFLPLTGTIITAVPAPQ